MAVVRDHAECHGSRPLVEASGGITLEQAAIYAATRVDCISTSALTSGAGMLDLGLDLRQDLDGLYSGGAR
jgi:nicotinate-nucleotide pyrophosphorylase (carboxylating)